MPDHIHILLGLKPDIMPSKLIQEIKANSSRFLNSKKLVKGKFYWQEGYGVFSYARSQVDVVAKYIQNQERQHAKRTFKSEYVSLLKKFDVEFEEKYLFDWHE